MIANYDKWREELLPAFCITFHGLEGDDDDRIYFPFQERFCQLMEEARANGHDDKRVFQTLLRLFTGEVDVGPFETCISTVASMGFRNHQLFLETFLEELPRMMGEHYEKGAATNWAFDCLHCAVEMEEFPKAFSAATEEQKALVRQLATKIDNELATAWMDNQETDAQAATIEKNIALIRGAKVIPFPQEDASARK
jgi:hypothetical protein